MEKTVNTAWYAKKCALGTLVCCGTELVQPSRGRKRKFCSDACCRKWWSENPQAIRQSPEALYESTCLNCGKVFTAYGNSHRRYCCHPCYIEHRFGSCASE